MNLAKHFLINFTAINLFLTVGAVAQESGASSSNSNPIKIVTKDSSKSKVIENELFLREQDIFCYEDYNLHLKKMITDAGSVNLRLNPSNYPHIDHLIIDINKDTWSSYLNDKQLKEQIELHGGLRPVRAKVDNTIDFDLDKYAAKIDKKNYSKIVQMFQKKLNSTFDYDVEKYTAKTDQKNYSTIFQMMKKGKIALELPSSGIMSTYDFLFFYVPLKSREKNRLPNITYKIGYENGEKVSILVQCESRNTKTFTAEFLYLKSFRPVKKREFQKLMNKTDKKCTPHMYLGHLNKFMKSVPKLIAELKSSNLAMKVLNSWPSFDQYCVEKFQNETPEERRRRYRRF